MNNAGIEISNNPDIFHAMKRDDGQTVLAIWNRVVPHKVQACLDAVDIEKLKLKKFFMATAKILPADRPEFPELQTYFDFVDADRRIIEAITGKKEVATQINIYAAGKGDGSREWHTDPPMTAADWEAHWTCILKSHTSQVAGGEMEYVDREDARRAMQKSASDYFICTDESAICKLPIGAIGMILRHRERGLRHRAGRTPEGFRWRHVFYAPGF